MFLFNRTQSRRAAALRCLRSMVLLFGLLVTIGCGDQKTGEETASPAAGAAQAADKPAAETPAPPS